MEPPSPTKALSRVDLFLERFPGETSRADGRKSQSQRRNDTAIVLHQSFKSSTERLIVDSFQGACLNVGCMTAI